MKRSIVMVFVAVAALIMAASVQAKEWETDFKRASSGAEKTSKYMLLYFSGSDWCTWCKKLDKEVFEKRSFKDYSRKNLVCVTLDFPEKKSQRKKLKKQNQALAEKYGVRGYPTVLILSPQGNPVARTGYRAGGAKNYVEHLEGIISAHKEK